MTDEKGEALDGLISERKKNEIERIRSDKITQREREDKERIRER